MSPSATPAPLWRRLAAGLYDLFPVLALWMATGAVALGLSGGAMDVKHPPLAYRLALLGVTVGYFVLSWVFGGQTLGARAWRVRVAAADGNPPRIGAALLRFAVCLVSWAALGLGFWWALFDAQRRTWHDIAARTVLLRRT